MLNVDRLTSAGFTDEDMDTILYAFEVIGKQLAAQVAIIDDLPFTDDQVSGALGVSNEILEKIDSYRTSKAIGAFSAWIDSFEEGK